MPVKVKSFMVVVVAAVIMLFPWRAFASTATEKAAASSPTQQLKAGADNLIQVLKDQSLKTEEGKKLLEDKVVQLFHQHFDLTYTSQMCLGRYWRKLSKAEKKEFVDLFTELLKSTYLKRVHEYSGQSVEYNKEIIKGRKALVKTKFIDKGKEIPVDYKMLNRDGQWRVYDVIVEGVSLVRNYRSQFSSILRKKKFADLLDQIRDKIARNKAAKDVAGEPQKG